MKRRAAIFFIFFYFVYTSNAQILDSTLAIYISKYQPERVYLHYDKAVYGAGETIWFKAYLMEGMLPAEGSKTLYIDWVDEKGNLLHQTVSPILAGGTTHGHFDIPESYRGRLIRVSAYTTWMLNFDTTFIYTKDIRIIQTTSTPVTAVPGYNPTLQFFPEGGNMISGLRNKVAFKAQDKWGNPLAIKGVVQKDGNDIDSLKVIHDGMGFFYLIPEEGARYTAKWKDQENLEHISDLPHANTEGVSLNISFNGTRRIFTVEGSPGILEQQKILHLIGTMHQRLVLKASVNLKESTLSSGVLPVETLSSGVLTLTLFDSHWNALAERIVHINNGESLCQLNSSAKTLGLSQRGRNEIELTVPDSLQANLSVSITDGSLETDSSDNIVSRFLLTSELRGSINNPSYYFKNTSDSISQKLDLVMLTNGWRRFKWEDVTKGKFPVINYLKETSYLSLSGKLVDATPSQLQNGGTVMMISRAKKDSVTRTIFVDIKNDGSFKSDLIFFDSLKVYYQLPKNIGKARIDFMQSKFIPRNYNDWKIANSISPFQISEYTQTASVLKEIYTIKNKELLQGVTVTARRRTKIDSLDNKYTHGLFSGGDAKQFDLLTDPLSYTYTNALHYLQGKVAGLQILQTIDPDGLLIYRLNWRGGQPIVYINEMPVNDPDELVSLAANNIAYIKVFRPPFMGVRGSRGDPANGAIAIYTKRGGDGLDRYEESSLPNSIVFGYSPVREFSSPDYATIIGVEKTDVRTTLLWKPNVRTEKGSHKVLLSFYNSDLFSKSLRIIVEGVTNDGRLTHFEQLIK